MELWDAYDENLRRLEGVTLVRGEPIPDGVYHLVCDVLVRHADGQILLMQRDLAKRGGGKWEATAGGSALQGETPQDCAVRELREETGIAANDLTELTREVNPTNHTYYVEYLCVTHCDKNSVILQEGETMAYRWVDVDTVKAMREDSLITLRMRCYLDSRCE